MAAHTQTLTTFRPNVGKIDRVFRYLLAALMIGAVLSSYDFADSLPEYWEVIALLAVPLVFTALTRWDPIYALLRIRTTASDLWFKAGAVTNDFLENLTMPRRIVRLSAAAGLIGGAIAFGGETMTWEPYAILLSIPLAMTGIIGWAPIEAMVKEDEIIREDEIT